ncbi:MAG: BamA/TamA family outer membrane protein [Pseudomonadota bacterium]
MGRTQRVWLFGALAGLATGLALWASTSVAFDLRFRAAGAGDQLQDALRASSLLIEARNSGTDNPADILAAARADYGRLVGALYARARFGATVSIRVDGREAAEIDPLAELQEVKSVEVRIAPGPIFRFSEARIAPLPRKGELPEDFRVGAPARTPVIEAAVDAAVEGWRGAGHAKADVGAQTITANHDTQTLAARIAINEGPALRFGSLELDGTSAVSARRIRKIAGLPTGKPFDPEDLERSARRLRETGTFRTVTLREAAAPNADGTLDIILNVADQKPRRFGFGAEIESTEGLTLSAFWLHRNLRGGAERFRFDAELGGIGGDSGGTDVTLGFELGRPATPNAKTDAFLVGEIAQLDEPEFTSDTASLGVGFVREINDRTTTRAGLGYSFSDVTDASGQTQYRQIFLPLGVTHDRRDAILNTSDGYYVDLELTPFFGLSDSESGSRATLDARGFQEFGAQAALVIAARVQAGSIFGASITGLPNEDRFTSGGGGTVRGHEYQSLDLDLGGGLRSGGRSFLGLQSEIRGRINEDVSLVGFFDWAMIGEDSVPGSGGISHSGAGVGLRYDTGIGPIRLDIGVPVSGPDDPSGFQIYVGIGQAF